MNRTKYERQAFWYSLLAWLCFTKYFFKIVKNKNCFSPSQHGYNCGQYFLRVTWQLNSDTLNLLLGKQLNISQEKSTIPVLIKINLDFFSFLGQEQCSYSHCNHVSGAVILQDASSGTAKWTRFVYRSVKLLWCFLLKTRWEKCRKIYK